MARTRNRAGNAIRRAQRDAGVAAAGTGALGYGLARASGMSPGARRVALGIAGVGAAIAGYNQMRLMARGGGGRRSGGGATPVARMAAPPGRAGTGSALSG